MELALGAIAGATDDNFTEVKWQMQQEKQARLKFEQKVDSEIATLKASGAGGKLGRVQDQQTAAARDGH